MSNKVAIFDLDGTVNSSTTIRSGLVPKRPFEQGDWSGWHSAHVDEKINPSMVELAIALRKEGYLIVVVSNRLMECSGSTSRQLTQNKFPWDLINLREVYDNRKPEQYKKDTIAMLVHGMHLGQIETTSNEGSPLSVLFFDDCKKTIDAVRSLNMVTCIHVAEYKG